MKKLLATTLIASMLTSTVAVAQEITPLDTTASTQADSLPFLATLPPGAIVVGIFVVVAGVVVGVTDGT